jgi:hypothetical protein
VHQFSGAQKDIEASAQVTMTLLAEYLNAMGVGRELLTVASLTGRSLQLGEGGIAADIRYAFGTPMSCSKRSPMPDAMPQRQHTP